MHKKNKIYKRNKKNKTYNNLYTNYTLFLILFIFIMSIIFGAIFINIMDLERKKQLTIYLGEFFTQDFSNNLDVFKQSFIKYFKIAIVIWLLAFVPFGNIFSAFILGFKGISLGYTTSLFAIAYGVKGIYYAIILYFFQNFILIPTYILLTYKSIKLNKKRCVNLEYVILLFICLAIIITISFIESYFVPSIIKNLA